MSPSIKVYGVPLSVHTRKVIVAARLKSVPIEVVPVTPVIPETLPPAWRALSPTGLIPVMEDGGYALADSTAILLYLERKYPRQALLPPDLQDYGRALFLDAWAGGELFRKVVHPLFHQQIVFPKIRRQPGDGAAIEAARDRAWPEAQAYLEGLSPDTYLAGGTVTLADLAVVSNLVMIHYLGERIDAVRYPKLSAYFQRHLRSPALQRALEEERPYAEKLGLDLSFLR